MYKFEKLEVWELSLQYSDLIYSVARQLPETERFNLASQIIRAATSLSLNIAEGSTGQSNSDQSRFLGMAQRSLIEPVACLKFIERRHFTLKENPRTLYDMSEVLFAKLAAFRKSITKRS